MTPRQKGALDFIKSYQATNGGVSPSLGDIAAGLGIKARSNAWRLVDGLVRLGFITKGGRHARREIRVLKN